MIDKSIADSGKPLLVTSRKLELYQLEWGEYAVSRQIISVLTKLPNGYISKRLNGSKSTRKYLSRGGWVKVLSVLSFLDEFRQDLPGAIARMDGFEFVEFIFNYRHSVIQLSSDQSKDECHDESVDLLELWQQILVNVEEIPARAILSTYCSIVELNGKEIKIGVHQKSSFNLVKQRSPQLGKACAKTLRCGVKLSLVVIEGKAPAVQPMPIAPSVPPAPRQLMLDDLSKPAPTPVPKPVVTTARSGETDARDMMSRASKTARSGKVLKVSEVPGSGLVVDSRLIADRLGIKHENFMETVDEYRTQAEQAFGVFRFQTGKPKTRSGSAIEDSKGGRPQKYVLLTEDQATFLMSLSRNTPEVVQCKIDLVAAFSKAKSLLSNKSGQTNQPDRDRLEARLILKQETHHALTSAIKRHLVSIGRYDSKSQSTSCYFAKILDLVNVLLTGETSRQMSDRLSKEKGAMVTASDAIRDWFDTSLIMKFDRLCYCAVGLMNDGVEPEIAVEQAFAKFLPGHIAAKPKFTQSKTDVKLLQSR